jgi:lactobin A/cerein 7B family class IIb bacteriocin
MKELNEMELKEVEGGYAKLPSWVKGGLWGLVGVTIIENWAEIKSGIVDGWTDAMNE